MTEYRRDINGSGCCKNWKNGIRTINGQYPDDNREFNVEAGDGIIVTPATAGIRITNSTDPGAIQAGSNIETAISGDKLIISLAQNIAVGNLNVAGDIIQQGSSYETHMEKVYTTNDYITMREGAVSGLSQGQYAGFEVEKYDGTNNGRLVIDNQGTARVGDVGDEQPLLTREESADLANGELLQWNAADQKAVGVPMDSAPTANSTNPVTSGGVKSALNDTVTLTTQQIITANKIFDNAQCIVRSGNYPVFTLQDVNSYIGDNTIGEFGALRGIDSNENRMAEVRFYKNYNTTQGEIVVAGLRAYKPSNLADSAILNVINANNGEKYMNGPNRITSLSQVQGNTTYNNDVVTIGTLKALGLIR